MFKGIMFFALVLLFSVSFSVAGEASPAAIKSPAAPASKVVATVNGFELTEAELNQEINILMPMNQAFHGNTSEEKLNKIRTDALKNLVDLELKAQAATAKGIKVPKAVLDEEFGKMVVKFKTKEKLAEAYKNSGFTEKSFKRMIERKQLADRIRVVEVDDAVTVTPEKVKNYYAANVARYNKPEEYRASHILIKVDPAAALEEKAALKDKTEKLLIRIKAGERFEEIAINESNDNSRIKGGDLGFFHAGQTDPVFEEALIKLKVGETSPVVESLYGYHIIRLTEKRESRQIPFEEIKDKLQKDMVNSEKKLLQENWMNGLYKAAKISYPGAK